MKNQTTFKRGDVIVRTYGNGVQTNAIFLCACLTNAGKGNGQYIIFLTGKGYMEIMSFETTDRFTIMHKDDLEHYISIEALMKTGETVELPTDIMFSTKEVETLLRDRYFLTGGPLHKLIAIYDTVTV